MNVIEETAVKSKWTTRRKILVAFLIPLAISLLVVMPALFWELHEANTALHSFSNALIAKRYGPAYDSASKEFRASVDLPTFTKVHDGLTARMGDLKSIEITSSEVKDRVDGWYGTAEVNMNFAHGSLPFSFILKKEDSSWKIYSYHEQ
jgi:hypothetical protein